MGGCRCSYKNCKNTTKTTDNIHFFHYPVKHKERCKIWIENACKQKFYELEEDQLRNKVICEAHFEDRWFPNCQKKRLLQGAVPTIDAGAEEEPPPPEQQMFVSRQLSDVKVIPASEDGTIFILDSENMYSRSPKIESYVYKNGVLVPSNSNARQAPIVAKKATSVSKPSTSRAVVTNVYYNTSHQMDFEPEGEVQNSKGDFGDIVIKKEVPEMNNRQIINTPNRPEASVGYVPFGNLSKPHPSSVSNNVNSNAVELEKKTLTQVRQSPVKNVIVKTEKVVNRNYLRKIKQHSRDIASIKRMLMNKKAAESKPDTKSVLNFLQERLPPSLHTIVSLILGDKNELTEEDIEFFTTFHRTSPEGYQLISEKYQWNLPSVDIVEGPNE